MAEHVEWAPRALDDLVDIEEYIAKDSRLAGERWVARLVTRAAQAAFVPKTGRVVPELGDPQVREVFLRDYRIICRLLGRGIRVLRVIHGARRLRGV